MCSGVSRLRVDNRMIKNILSASKGRSPVAKIDTKKIDERYFGGILKKTLKSHYSCRSAESTLLKDFWLVWLPAFWLTLLDDSNHTENTVRTLTLKTFWFSFSLSQTEGLNENVCLQDVVLYSWWKSSRYIMIFDCTQCDQYSHKMSKRLTHGINSKRRYHVSHCKIQVLHVQRCKSQFSAVEEARPKVKLHSVW